MPWKTCPYSRGTVDRVGAKLLARSSTSQERTNARAIVNAWRSAHGFPLNALQIQLRKLARQADPSYLVAQRIKRLPSIVDKLQRFPSMNLTQMQDIGGCRAIVSEVQEVSKLVNLHRNSRMKHELYDIDDYISSPKKSGYRGIHLKYMYRSNKHSEYDGLRIEVQLRSRLQHVWATAVETVSVFTMQALKSSLGSADWLRFFALASSAIADIEGADSVPGTPATISDLLGELREYANRLDAINVLHAYGNVIQSTKDQKGAHYFLMVLDSVKREIDIRGFSKKAAGIASRQYYKAERAIAETPGSQAVLVSVDSFRMLEKAYPNYFGDTKEFINALLSVLGDDDYKLMVPGPGEV